MVARKSMRSKRPRSSSFTTPARKEKRMSLSTAGPPDWPVSALRSGRALSCEAAESMDLSRECAAVCACSSRMMAAPSVAKSRCTFCSTSWNSTWWLREDLVVEYVTIRFRWTADG